jgi:ribonuclease P/MRP protein subunit POP5
MVRFKNRYFLLEFEFHGTSQQNVSQLSAANVSAYFRSLLETFYGDMGYALVGTSLSVKYFNPITKICIVRVPRAYYRWLWASLTMSCNFAQRSCMVHVLHTGGTIRSCARQAIKYHRQKIAKIQPSQHASTLIHSLAQDEEKKLSLLDS